MKNKRKQSSCIGNNNELIDIVHMITEEGPYYTSYPTLSIWSESFDSRSYAGSLLNFFSQYGKDEPIHLYIHIPFCDKLCWYCICNIEVTKNRAKIQFFLEYLYKEINLLSDFMLENDIEFNITEVHLGGGTPSHLYDDQLLDLVKALEKVVNFSKLQEFSMEIDPRTTSKSDLFYYAKLGVDRISFGIQDFNIDVQTAINRIQPVELINKILDEETRSLFRGINFDLLYGLPLQTQETFRETIGFVTQFRPDRVTLLKYAHVPHLRNHMKLIKDDDLPPDNDLPKMFIDAVQMFKSAGYIWIGIDNFVLENDDNAIAAERNDLLRTFNGFTPGRTHHMIALGPSSTSSFGPYYFQSFYSHEEYYQSLDQEKFPIMKGHTTSDDELIRRYVIFGLLCHQEVLFIDVMQKYNVSFVDYFNLELSLMEEKFGKYNVLLINKDKISVNDRGRYVIRSICRVFDRYYHNKNYNIVGP